MENFFQSLTDVTWFKTMSTIVFCQAEITDEKNANQTVKKISVMDPTFRKALYFSKSLKLPIKLDFFAHCYVVEKKTKTNENAQTTLFNVLIICSVQVRKATNQHLIVLQHHRSY